MVAVVVVISALLLLPAVDVRTKVVAVVVGGVGVEVALVVTVVVDAGFVVMVVVVAIFVVVVVASLVAVVVVAPELGIGRQALEPLGENVLAGHGVGAVAPTGEYIPAGDA